MSKLADWFSAGWQMNRQVDSWSRFNVKDPFLSSRWWFDAIGSDLASRSLWPSFMRTALRLTECSIFLSSAATSLRAAIAHKYRIVLSVPKCSFEKPRGKSNPRKRGKLFRLHVCCWIPSSFRPPFLLLLLVLPGAKYHPPILFEIQCQASRPGYNTEFKKGHPTSPLLLLPNKETEGVMTKYAGEDIMQSTPPALHLTVLCARV